MKLGRGPQRYVIREVHESAIRMALLGLDALGLSEADIDRAEREQELAWQVNVVGAQRVAGECARRGLRHLFFSSDAVFSGAVGRERIGEAIAAARKRT